MAIHFNHTILSAHDSKASAIFLAEMLNLPAPRRWGPFQMVVTENGANLDYMDTDGEITPQHYAFLISEAEFDEIFGRIRDRKLSYWADPGRRQLGEINHHDGGRGVYFEDPNGHLLEIITRPYFAVGRAGPMLRSHPQSAGAPTAGKAALGTSTGMSAHGGEAKQNGQSRLD